MKNLVITEDSYNKALALPETTPIRKLLEVLMGKAIVSTDIRDHVPTFEAACLIAKPTKEQERDLKEGSAFAKASVTLEIIYKALRTNPVTGEVTKIDWQDGKSKYEALWIYKPGVGFVFCDSDGAHAYSLLGSRLALYDKSLCSWAAKTFEKEWNAFLIEL